MAVRRLAQLGLLLAAAITMAVPLVASNLREDPVDENYLIGSLTWKAGKGGISWSASPDTEDDVTPTPADASYVGWTIRASTGGRDPAGLVAVDTFTSEPLPQPAYLNVSRVIQLDIRTKGPRAHPDVELRAGGQFFSGGIWEGPTDFIPAVGSSGYQTASHRMQAEVAFLPKGSVITLSVIHTGDSFTSYTYGFRGEHASVLRIPLYPPDELAFRLTGSKVAAASDEAAGPVGAPWVALMAGPALMFGRRGAWTGLVAALVLVSGCAGPATPLGGGPDASGDGFGGRATVDYVDPPENSTEQGGKNGSVVGTVHDEDGFALFGVHVALLGTTIFGNTANDGRFSFPEVPAGRYTIRIEKQEFKSLETGLVVIAGRTARIDAALFPAVDKGAPFRAHKHDLWTSDVQTIFDGDVTMVNGYIGDAPHTCFGSWAFLISSSHQTCDVPVPVAGENKPILPGTTDVEVIISWATQTSTVERAGIAYVSNDQPSSNLTFMYPKASGAATHVRTNWEMTDNGHQQFSTWAFRLYILTNKGNLRANNQVHLDDKFHVTINIHRGVLPIERPHLDHWADNDTLAITKNQEARVFQSLIILMPTLPSEASVWALTGPPIPPETRWLEIRMAQTAAHDQSPDWILLAKPANQGHTDGRFDNYKTIPNPTKGGLVRTYQYPLLPGEADGAYARRSLWRFAVDDGTDATQPYASADRNPWILSLTVTAHRDPLPA